MDKLFDKLKRIGPTKSGNCRGKLKIMRSIVEGMTEMNERKKKIARALEYLCSDDPDPIDVMNYLTRNQIVVEGDVTFTRIPFDDDWREGIKNYLRNKME